MPKKSGKIEEQPTSFSLLTDFDIHLFRSGKHFKLYEKLGAHVVTPNDKSGTFFAVWAPNAKEVSVIGNFSHWQRGHYKLTPRWDESGIWEGFFAGIHQGEAYKYAIVSNTGEVLEKADPFAFYAEVAPNTASIVWEPGHTWTDQQWQQKKRSEAGSAKPYSVYEVHFGSWRRKVEEDNRSLTYGEMKTELVRYVKDLGFTHVEFLPLMEHPFYGSWGLSINRIFCAYQSLWPPGTIDGTGRRVS